MNISKLCLIPLFAFAFTAPLCAHKNVNISSGFEEPPITFVL